MLNHPFVCHLSVPSWKLIESSLCHQHYDVLQRYFLIDVVLTFLGERHQKLIFLFCKHLKKLLLTLVLHFLHPLFLEFIILMLLLYDWFPNFLKFYLLFSTSLFFCALWKM